VAILEVQKGDSGSVLIASGSSFNTGSTPAAGNTVVLVIFTGLGTAVTAVSGLGITWPTSATAKAPKTTTNSGPMEIWVGTGANGSTKAITVTAGSDTYAAQYTEFSGIGTAVSAGTSGPTTSANPNFTATPGIGDVLLVATEADQIFTAGPATPWVDYNTGTWWIFANGIDVAYQIAAGSGAITATWTMTSSQWSTAGVILSPPAVSGPPIAGFFF